MPGERKRAEGGDEGSDGGEDGNFDEDLRAGGGAEAEELAKMLELDAAGGLEQAVAVAAVGLQDGDEQHGHEVEAGEAGGPGGADDSVGGDVQRVGAEAPVVAVDEDPVADEVDEVGGDEREGDGFGEVRGLQVAAEGEVERAAGRRPS